MNLEQWTARISDNLSREHSRRSFMGRLGKVAMIISGASLIEALELAAPSATALASHCNGGYHAGASCANQTSCAANGWTTGQYWLSCCSGGTGGPCGNCFEGWKYTKFKDCCGTGSCGGKSSAVYCPSGTCFKCKIQSCTTTTCHGPRCL